MMYRAEPASSWARRLADLRAQASRRSRPVQPSEVADEALSICEALVRELAGAQLTCERLRADVSAADAAWDHLFHVMPSACVLTDSAGVILSANRAASGFLNATATGLKGRELLVFSQDREIFRTLLKEIQQNVSSEMRAELMVRPRDRKPLMTRLHVVAAPDRDRGWLWMMTRAVATDAAAPETDWPAPDGLSSTGT